MLLLRIDTALTDAKCESAPENDEELRACLSVAHVLLTAKLEAVYRHALKGVLNCLFSVGGTVRPATVCSDFEVALMNAIACKFAFKS